MEQNRPTNLFQTIRVYFDGECPFCSRYAFYQSLSSLADKFEVVDMRSPETAQAMNDLIEAGINPGDGVVVQIQGLGDKGFSTTQGAKAMKTLAALDNSGRVGAFALQLFKVNWIGKAMFPILKSGRFLLLRAMGIRLSPFESNTANIQSNKGPR